MTVPKNYRASDDDGLVAGLALAPLIASALLYNSVTSDELPKWESTLSLAGKNTQAISALDALIRARCNAVNLGTLCAVVLLIHVWASARFEARYRRLHPSRGGDGDERGSVPRSEMRKWWLYVAFSAVVSGVLTAVRMVFARVDIGIWQRA
jgi:dolichol kinase